MNIERITRDTNGRLLSWCEDSTVYEVVWNSFGKPAVVWAKFQQLSNKGPLAFNYDQYGALIGVENQGFKSIHLAELLAAAGSPARTVAITASEAASPSPPHLSIANRLVTWVTPDGTRWQSNATSSAAGTMLIETAPLTPRRAMLTVACGNSIANQAKYGFAAGTWAPIGELMLTPIFGGGCMRFVNMTATTRSDANGVYGYSGQTLATILADIQAQWFDQLDGAGVTPELVVGLALLENDIATGRTVAQMTADLTTWIRWVQMHWRNVVILLCTPRPSFSYNTAQKVSNYQAMRDYMLALDDGLSIITARCDGYESAATPGQPDSFQITASRSGTTLTVTEAASTLRVGQAVSTAPGVNETFITAYGTGTGGTGTYTTSSSATIASQAMSVAPYTDSTVHPRVRAAMLNARAMAAAMMRVSRKWQHPGVMLATNPALTGSGDAGGTGVSGTVPTSCAVGGSANGTCVSTAENPGWTVQFNNNAQGQSTDIGTFSHASQPLSGYTQISPYMRVQIVSGADRLRSIALEPRINDAGGNTFHYHVRWASADGDGVFQDGDELTFIVPPQLANSGAIAACQNYLRPSITYEAGANPVSVRILESGVIALTGEGQGQFYTPAAAGTVTIDASKGNSVRINLPAGNVTVAAPTNAKLDQRLDVTILQDSVGGRTITWNAAFKKAADGAGGANGVGATSFVYNGANWVQVGGALSFA